MVGHMRSVIRKQHKIFKAVVVSPVIYMVNNFFGFQISAKMLLHYKAVLTDVPVTVFEWVFGGANEHISPAGLCSSVIPTGVIGTYPALFSPVTFAYGLFHFFRNVFAKPISSGVFQLRLPHFLLSFRRVFVSHLGQTNLSTNGRVSLFPLKRGRAFVFAKHRFSDFFFMFFGQFAPLFCHNAQILTHNYIKVKTHNHTKVRGVI